MEKCKGPTFLMKGRKGKKYLLTPKAFRTAPQIDQRRKGPTGLIPHRKRKINLHRVSY